MWAGKDEFHFVWKRMKGISFFAPESSLSVKASIRIAKSAGLFAQPRPGFSPRQCDRPRRRPDLIAVPPNERGRHRGDELYTKGQDVVQLERKGDSYMMSVANFGEKFVMPETLEIPLGDEVYVGLYVCSHNNNVFETAVFRDVEICPCPRNFVPYQDTSAAIWKSWTWPRRAQGLIPRQGFIAGA